MGKLVFLLVATFVVLGCLAQLGEGRGKCVIARGECINRRIFYMTSGKARLTFCRKGGEDGRCTMDENICVCQLPDDTMFTDPNVMFTDPNESE